MTTDSVFLGAVLNTHLPFGSFSAGQQTRMADTLHVLILTWIYFIRPIKSTRRVHRHRPTMSNFIKLAVFNVIDGVYFLS